MIPTNYTDDLVADYTTALQPTRTYNLRFDGEPSLGMLDGLEAMKQAAFLILQTERFFHEIYSWGYGIELRDKIGAQNDAVLQSQIQAAVSDALLADDRILAVKDFAFMRIEKKGLEIRFTVETTQGEIPSAVVWSNGHWEVKA